MTRIAPVPIGLNVNLKMLPTEMCTLVYNSSLLIMNNISKLLKEGRYKSQNKTILYQSNFKILLVNTLYNGTKIVSFLEAKI